MMAQDSEMNRCESLRWKAFPHMVVRDGFSGAIARLAASLIAITPCRPRDTHSRLSPGAIQTPIFHGAKQPWGIQRTYPNVLNYEAVLGLEPPLPELQVRSHDGGYFESS